MEPRLPIEPQLCILGNVNKQETEIFNSDLQTENIKDQTELQSLFFTLETEKSQLKVHLLTGLFWGISTTSHELHQQMFCSVVTKL